MEEETLENNLLFLDTNAGRTQNPTFAFTSEYLHPKIVDVCGVLLVKNSENIEKYNDIKYVKLYTFFKNDILILLL